MGAEVVVEMKILFDLLIGFRGSLILMEIDLLVFQGSPQPLGEDIVESSSFSVHADLDVMMDQDIEIAEAGELGSLIRVMDFRFSGTERLGESFNTEGIFQGIGEAEGNHIATEPIDDGNQIEKSMTQTNIRDVRSPDMIRMADGQTSEEIGILPMLEIRFAGIGSWKQGFNAHPTHEAADFVSANTVAFLVEFYPDPTRVVEGSEGVDLIDDIHESIIFWIEVRDVVGR